MEMYDTILSLFNLGHSDDYLASHPLRVTYLSAREKVQIKFKVHVYIADTIKKAKME